MQFIIPQYRKQFMVMAMYQVYMRYMYKACVYDFIITTLITFIEIR